MARGGKLTDKHRRFIVERLACFESPTQVAKALFDESKVRITRQSVQHYDPTHGAKPAKKWCAIFKATRERFLEERANIGIAHPVVRLHRLEQLYLIAAERGAIALAKDLLVEVERIEGGLYTNRRMLEHSGEVQGGVLVVPTPVSAEEWSQAARRQQALLGHGPNGNGNGNGKR